MLAETTPTEVLPPMGFQWHRPEKTTHRFLPGGLKDYCIACGIAEWAATTSEGCLLYDRSPSYNEGPTIWAGPDCERALPKERRE